jgi:hypothetical protein
MPSGSGPPLHGPFHRLRNPSTQSDAVAFQQQQSQQIWGRAARWSFIRSVKAYQGSLPATAQGIEFVASVAPSRNGPSNVFWDEGSPGVSVNGNGFAVITATITRKAP